VTLALHVWRNCYNFYIQNLLFLYHFGCTDVSFYFLVHCTYFIFQNVGRLPSIFSYVCNFCQKIQLSAYFYVDMQNFVEIRQAAAELMPIVDFENASSPSHLIFITSLFFIKIQISGYFYVDFKTLVKFRWSRTELLHIFHFENGSRAPSWISHFRNIYLRQHPKFGEDRTFCGQIISYFRFSIWQPSSILELKDFAFSSIIQISTFYVDMQNLVKIGHSAAELLHIFNFQNGGRPPSWISMTS